ncbi:septum formation initiator family protein [Isoptericola sp. b441]|uniref:Septum formation initiator family protein n=1 Tax=Actinotalea lenta TaxID=3064654 RepID=A0ABT9DBZ1_9CELL|nr:MULTISPECIES: septum formation initiator family protein [unclassified Isoptericola]MDO8106826.1 septum formation initiator family protein [Isoptericola sp. b441]MDO8121463.1 septum formation initiator family protein [Isoptericola sp. b490]
MTRRPATSRARRPSAGAPPRRGSDRPAPRAAERRATVERDEPGVGDLARLLSVRALLLGVVLLIGFTMVFPTVRAYLAQRSELSALAAKVAAAEKRETDLSAQLARWDTDAYVIAQARERLSYVMPGETAYRVIDPQVVTEQPHVSSSDPGSTGGLALPVGGAVAPWYSTIWSSVQLAGEAPLPGGSAPATQGGPAHGGATSGGPGGASTAPGGRATPGSGG